MFVEVGLFAYLIDRVLGEFPIKHPVVFMGDYIKWFEEKYYRDDVVRGAFLTLTLLVLTLLIIDSITLYIGYMSNIYVQTLLFAIIASTTISAKMLYESVKEIITNPQKIKYLVSRDTKQLSVSDINKASIETYAENLSDGVIAPLFYLFLFGINGAFVYKAINTLDSMVGYHNKRYEKFGKVSAIVDDIANYIPSRITALLIAILFWDKNALLRFYHFGKHHNSPNAGLPISAMALAVGVKLGGDTVYFGKLTKKAHFGDGRDNISSNDILQALSFQKRLDIFFIITLGVILYADTWR